MGGTAWTGFPGEMAELEEDRVSKAQLRSEGLARQAEA